MSRRLRRSDRLVWVDLEMTGLDPRTDEILEIATIITEADLTPVAEGPELVLSATAVALDAMVPKVREMHSRNGLLDDVRESQVTVADAERLTMEFLRQHCVTEPRVHPLCGNSVGTDRCFIARNMPAFDRFLHYRIIDVSSIKEVARRWNPVVFERRPDKGDDHRALADIRASIDELRYYRNALFRSEGETGPTTPRYEEEE